LDVVGGKCDEGPVRFMGWCGVLVRDERWAWVWEFVVLVVVG
jgi:hypothetical protein